jgi:hypothetical protein
METPKSLGHPPGETEENYSSDWPVLHSSKEQLLAFLDLEELKRGG